MITVYKVTNMDILFWNFFEL